MDMGMQWAIVLAAGEGSRLRSLTIDERGIATPKQFCSLRGDDSLLESALARAERLVPRDRVVVVVAAEHARWWRPQLAHLPPGNVVVQPRNRGTCPGLLLPLLSILRRDPQASVLVLPSDHFVADEARLSRSIGPGLTAAGRGETGVVLVGAAADAPSSDYGWIVSSGAGPFRRVAAFVEKPAPAEARRLLALGAAWNTFIFAARGEALVDLVDRRVPGLAAELRSAILWGGDCLSRFYDSLAAIDLSREVFGREPSRLRLAMAPACGWTDLGTPDRVAQCLAALPRVTRSSAPRSGRIVLADRLRGGLAAESA